MIWLTTLFMLIICAHLAKQALLEKRRYEATIVDGAADTDEGLFMQATKRFRPEAPESAVAAAQENSVLGRSVSFVGTHSARIGDAVERKAKQSLEHDDSSSLFGRATSKVSRKMETMGQGLERRIQSHQTQGSDESIRSPLSDDTKLARIASRVREQDDKFDSRMREKARRITLQGDDASNPEKQPYFNRMVAKVAKLLDSAEQGMFGKAVNRVGAMMDKQADTKLSANASDKEDFIIRTSRKLGDSMHAFDDRFINRFSHTNGPDTQR